jgi:hypothetical protein
LVRMPPCHPEYSGRVRVAGFFNIKFFRKYLDR